MRSVLAVHGGATEYRLLTPVWCQAQDDLIVSFQVPVSWA